MIFETHAHYDDEQFDSGREALLASLPDCGIKMELAHQLGDDGINDSTLIL